ncbi:Rpr2-domain-containing protein [Cucurbitaria berberidis CBS 394.84]|uniref:Rpr2-domain-containing protein n=1 Tax=Cucurbitaria berberidis CBS 394.84 TaxID=1168544 RepID=A0A9P4GUD0_9PLEO|nr:Rpr2-domain-containing protein [Cucurbitaria berberidis CBS 394.84]KAF1851701.1 Rpr2-domain-containing protein [Cucurbitaria berberidis CBS 394.84]
MSKVKTPKPKGVPNKHLHARTTFLYQAATYLTLQNAAEESKACLNLGDQTAQPGEHQNERPSPLALQLGSDLQQVSRKGQLRLSVDLKRSMCKSCNAILVPGRTANQLVENKSLGGKKPCADVLVVECKICGGKKRFPIGAKKQLKRSKRKAVLEETMSVLGSEDGPQSDSAPLTGTEQSSITG